MSYLEIPLSLSFEWVSQSKWTPYLSIGGSYSRLSDAGKLIGYADYDQNLIGSPIFFNDRDLFQNGEWGYIVGTGVLYSLKYLDLRAGVDLISGMSNLRDGNNANLKLYFEYAHSPDDLNLDRLYFHIGFVYDINSKTYEFSRK